MQQKKITGWDGTRACCPDGYCEVENAICQEVKSSESGYCGDNLDNDCDGLENMADPDCRAGKLLNQGINYVNLGTKLFNYENNADYLTGIYECKDDAEIVSIDFGLFRTQANKDYLKILGESNNQLWSKSGIYNPFTEPVPGADRIKFKFTSDSSVTDSGVIVSSITCDCSPSPENTFTTCSDGRDNDCDGLIDCEDANCAGLIGTGNYRCCPNGVSDCDDGLFSCSPENYNPSTDTGGKHCCPIGTYWDEYDKKCASYFYDGCGPGYDCPIGTVADITNPACFLPLGCLGDNDPTVHCTQVCCRQEWDGTYGYDWCPVIIY